MRRLISIIGLVALVGCASFQSNSGKFLASTAQTVDALMKGWAYWVVQNNVSTNQQAGIKSAYGTYQRAMLVASNAWEDSVLAGGANATWISASNAVQQAQDSL